ncbi:hypothetical protein INT44_006589 [Umbelopsis vinacea]|uniref:Uncharacterized protein n=1 Tax=Umbelopsis vinacea TaxID=44442 RepID=A0A8H7PTC4_9FUNG|nr:hypothetical protein INT44_006589 [Umbelopsis vinacea]
MSITFSPGCGNSTWSNIPAPIAGQDTCYISYAFTEMDCTMTVDKVPAPCHCDASDSCTSTNLPIQTLLCNGQPIAFPTGDPNVTALGSCTYKKAGSTSTTDSVTPSSAATNSATASSVKTTSAGISLTKSNMLIAASLVLCAVLGSF